MRFVKQILESYEAICLILTTSNNKHLSKSTNQHLYAFDFLCILIVLQISSQSL